MKKTTRYQIRDLGAGLLEPGGLNRDGAVTYTALVEQLSSFAITAIATVSSPYAPVMRLSSDASGRSQRAADAWDFFSSHAGAIDREGIAAGWAITAAPLGSSVMTEALCAEAGSVSRRLSPVAGFTSSAARAVGIDGTIVGDSANPETSVATAWRGREATRLDGGLPDATFSRAVAINGRGTVLGFFQTRSGAVRGWLRDANGGVESDVGPTGIDAFPCDLNDSGRVVGAAADQRGWFAHRSGSATRLALLPGTAVSAARGVNSAGAVVGDCDETACLWSPSGDASHSVSDLRPADLNALGTVPDGGRLHRAVRISDAGLILAAGSSHRGQHRVYLLSPYLTVGPRANEIPDEILFGLQPRAGIFGVQLCPEGLGRALLPLSKVCQLVSALECPACLCCAGAPCGSAWGISLEGVPGGVRVTLLVGDEVLGELVPGPRRGNSDPTIGRDGLRPPLEIVLSSRPQAEYFLGLERSGGATPEPAFVFPVHMTVFRAEDEPAHP